MTGLLLAGRVDHVRHAPFVHRFDYRLWMVSVDLDAVPCTRLFGHNRRAAVALHDRDHGPRDGGALRPWAEGQLRLAGLAAYAARIDFMFVPRVFGYAFNPIAFYFCHDAAGRLGAIIHQVKNTFGGQTPYVLAVDAARPIVQRAAKALHVSPFFDMRGGYRFAISPPDFTDAHEMFSIVIRYGTDDAPRMTASMVLRPHRLTDTTLLRQLAAMPLMPLKIVAAIHWQALRLWLRGARYHPVPTPTPASTGEPA